MKKYDINVANNRLRAEEFIKRVEEKKPLFICTIATTETAKIPGLSAAGKYPELTDYTPAADSELLFYGRCECIEGVPVTPEGIPTPALITMSALKLADTPPLIVNGGTKVKPHIPLIDLDGQPGADIRSGHAIQNAEQTLQRAKLAGRVFAKLADYLVIGESIPGGTTTALGTMLAMGIEARGKVSSSMPDNPHELKSRVVEEGMKNAGIKFGDLKDDPLRAVSLLGDPMIPAVAGLTLGAAEEAPVMLAGGTQMCAVVAVVNALKPELLGNLVVGTTRWILEDRSSDFLGILRQICDIPVCAADIDFSTSQFHGLRAYELGVVKEGVGAGGISVAAMLKTGGKVNKQTLLTEIEKNYGKLVGTR